MKLEYRIKKTISQFVPLSFLQFLKKIYDSFFYTHLKGKKKFWQWNSRVIYPHYFNKASIIYSGGVWGNISFEKQLATAYNAEIYLFDPSPTGIETMQLPENQNPHLHFFPYGFAWADKDYFFDDPTDYNDGSFHLAKKHHTMKTYSFPCKSLSNLCKNSGHHHIDLLKIDIEWFEYEVLEDILKSDIPVHQICVEFHDFFDHIPLSKTMWLLQLLKELGYVTIHKHMKDYTFLHQSKIHE